MNTWLVFHDVPGQRWWGKYLKPGFQHVSVLQLITGTWVLIRPMYARTLVEALPYTEGDLPHTVHPDATFLPIQINETERLRALVGLHTCVGFAKAIMGIRAPLILTPYQLFKHCTHGYTGIIPSAGIKHSGSVDQSQTDESRQSAGHSESH